MRNSGAASVPNPKPADRIVTRGRGSIERTSSGTTTAWNGIGRPSRAGLWAETRSCEGAVNAITGLATGRRPAAIGSAVAGGPASNLIPHEPDQPGLPLLPSLERADM